MGRRLFARWLCIAGMVVAGAGIIQPWHAAAHPLDAHKTYANASFAYTFNYPSNWQRAKASDVQFIAYAPDHNAFVTANAVHGTISVSEIKAAQKRALGQLGKLQGKVTYALKSINGLTFQTAEALVKGGTGRVLDAILLDTVQHGALYDFDAGVVAGTPVTDHETVALQNSLNSITIK